jgi:hypothetical protein
MRYSQLVAEAGRGEKTRRVREIAARSGLSERTVWRHLAAGTLDQLTPQQRYRICDYCHTRFVPMTRWQRFCQEKHRIYHHRHGPKP